MHLLIRPLLLLAFLPAACTTFEFADRHVTGSVEHPGDGLVIPDADSTGLSDKVQIDEDCVIVTVEVEVEIRHAWAADVSIDLLGPSNTIVRLLAAEDFDDGERDIDEVFPSTFDSFGDLVDFDAEQGRGEWTLVVRDEDDEHEGRLEGWLLRLGCKN